MKKIILATAIFCSITPTLHPSSVPYSNLPKHEFTIENETKILLTWDRIIVEATAYNESEEDCEKPITHPLYGITASGGNCLEGRTVAMDDSVPFGTDVYIPSRKKTNATGLHKVEDRGGAITRGYIDIYISSRQEGLVFGRRNIEIYLPKGVLQ